MPDHSSVPNALVCGHQSVCAKVQAVLRSAQAKGWTDAQLEELSGVPARTIKSYRIEGKEPGLANILSLAVVLGQSAINPLLSLIGYVASPMDEADDMAPAQIVADSLKALSVIALAAADGRIDHTEAPLCRDAADEMIAAVLSLSSAGGAQ